MGARAASEKSTEADATIKRMTSQVNWAFLGLLMERPDYRYRLEQRFESAYGDVLSLSSPSHISTALNELKRRGMIEKVPGRRAARSDRDSQAGARYRITVEGARSYREHMLSQISEDRRQSRLFARQLAVLACEPDVALEILDHRQRACLVEASRARGSSAGDSLADSSRALADRLVFEDSRLAAESTLPWIDLARSEFEALQRESRR